MKMASFWLECYKCENGHNCDEIDAAIKLAKFSDKPSMIILNTKKAKEFLLQKMQE